MSETYRPLPDYLTIKESPIEGLGLFATEDIEININPDIGVVLGVSHVISNGKLERTPIGGWINHSENPNCYISETYISSLPDDQTPHYNLMLIKNIKAGEELTVDYSKTFCGDYYKEFE